MSHEIYMRRALELAQEAGKQGEVPVGAVVVKDGEVIGEGYNRPISSHDPSAHAEIIALRAAAAAQGNYRLSDCSLYVTIEPCSMCAGAMVHARVKQLVYGANEPRAGVAQSQQKFFTFSWLNHSVQVTPGVMAEESSRLIQDFFRERRKKTGDK